MGKTSIYLTKDEEGIVRKLAREYGSRSEVIRVGLAALMREKIEAQLVEKYSGEIPIPDRIAKIQRESASDLGDYPW